MRQYAFLADADLCVGCYACIIACKQENDLPAGLNYIGIDVEEILDSKGRLSLNFVPIHCMHCDNPACVDSCPELAITKREDGIVTVDSHKCNGCGLCIEACPVGAIKIDPRNGSAAMCHMCHHRIKKGLEPSCVMHCFTKALKFGFQEDFLVVEPGKSAKCTVNCRYFENLRGLK